MSKRRDSLSYDAEADALYINFRWKTGYRYTLTVDEGTLIDADQDGPLGIEILGASKRWPWCLMLPQVTGGTLKLFSGSGALHSFGEVTNSE